MYGEAQDWNFGKLWNTHGDGVDLRVIATVVEREAGAVGGVLKLRGD